MSGSLSSVVSRADSDVDADSPADSPADADGAGRPPVAASPIPVRYHRALLTLAATTGVVTVWAACTWMSLHLHADPVLHRVALFAHLASLVLGFGTVLVIDYYGLLWLIGRRSLPDTIEGTAALHAPVWLGVGGLLLTGTLLHPDPTAPLTQVKLLLVLVIALNGVHATALHHRLADLGHRSPTTGLLMRGGASAVVSQISWWGAVVIGFLNSRS
ncbi:hypothetical protein ACWGQ4_22665 [Streptomyces sp. NPDC055721]|uniref:hypothetical protein n=1 Tax=Streptomyces sp. NPDC127132 TaxID=3345374 RepID=UPI003631C6DC